MPRIPADSLNALTYDRGTQMPYMKRLRHIGTAVVNNDLFHLFRLLQTEFLCSTHFPQIIPHKGLLHFHIQETRRHCSHLRKHVALVKLLCHLLGDHKRRLMVFLRTGHGAVTLILTKIRPVGQGDPSQFRVVTCRLECFFHFF